LMALAKQLSRTMPRPTSKVRERRQDLGPVNRQWYWPRYDRMFGPRCHKIPASVIRVHKKYLAKKRKEKDRLENAFVQKELDKLRRSSKIEDVTEEKTWKKMDNYNKRLRRIEMEAEKRRQEKERMKNFKEDMRQKQKEEKEKTCRTWQKKVQDSQRLYDFFTKVIRGHESMTPTVLSGPCPHCGKSGEKSSNFLKSAFFSGKSKAKPCTKGGLKFRVKRDSGSTVEPVREEEGQEAPQASREGVA
jgi:hypothetical protein